MADTVQYRMEKMSDELDDLEKRGLFTRLEISQIVKQRRNFEFKLKRPSPFLFDFLSYIDYEKSLDKLRLLRKKLSINININRHRGSIGMKNGIKKKKNKKMGSDYAGVRRILDIYGRVTKRFKGDVALWFQYLDYCREKKNGLMNKILGCAYFGPFGHYLHMLLDKIFKGKKDMKTVAKKVVLEQLTASPWNNLVFMLYYGLLMEGRPWPQVKSKIKKDYPSVQYASWTFWPVLGFINHQYVPLQFRVIFHRAVAMCWGIFLNLRARSVTLTKG